ncbi:hypothetical protein OESDEN_13331 [Oesophagostomum dentatum]|uniref:Uncharacterized protein n=1 Tax=Oesophagostomum dentatum TaxID=61180 RepID=A0A0B1SUL1_OESDE|nr:hypothetical protein OESDEN_13331 [Oesophagostomum dentatum]
MNLFFVVAFTTMLCGAVSGQYADYWMCSDPYYYTLCQDDIVSERFSVNKPLSSKYIFIKVALVVDPGYYDYPAYDYVIGIPIYVYDHGYAYPYADHPCEYYYRILPLKLDDLPP